jgi:hypothetical protein
MPKFRSNFQDGLGLTENYVRCQSLNLAAAAMAIYSGINVRNLFEFTLFETQYMSNDHFFFQEHHFFFFLSFLAKHDAHTSALRASRHFALDWPKLWILNVVCVCNHVTSRRLRQCNL